MPSATDHVSLLTPASVKPFVVVRIATNCPSIPLAILLSALVATGCSRPQRQPEDVDFGQARQRRVEPTPHSPEPRHELSADEPGRSPVPRNRANEADGGSDVAAGGQSHGAAGGPAAVPATGASDGVGERGGTGNDGVEGNNDGPGGASRGPKAPAPALPGREARRAAMEPDAAAALAARLIDRAKDAMRRGDVDSAAAAAIEAYDQVLPHAQTDKACGKLCGELETLLQATGRRQGRAAPVPTRFE